MDTENDLTAQVNAFLENELTQVNYQQGLEILLESLSSKIVDIFGRNALLSMLYQIGATTGSVVAKRIIEEQGKETFTPVEAFSLLFKTVRSYFKVMVKEIKQDEHGMSITFTNHCFLRNIIKDREKLRAGGRLCRITKGYIESAMDTLLKGGDQKVEVGFVENDEDGDCCLEKLTITRKR